MSEKKKKGSKSTTTTTKKKSSSESLSKRKEKEESDGEQAGSLSLDFEAGALFTRYDNVESCSIDEFTGVNPQFLGMTRADKVL